MKLNFSVDTDDLYEREINFETLLTDSLKREVIRSCSSNLASDKFKEFARLTSDTITAGIKLRLENFLSEEIVLVDQWGKKTFVGSIEDLIKKRFDEILLRPVDSSGKTLQGCALSGKTWVEWKLEKSLNEDITSYIKDSERKIEYTVKNLVGEKLTELKDNAVKKQVNAVFRSILQKEE